jgi:hypothetical protein
MITVGSFSIAFYTEVLSDTVLTTKFEFEHTFLADRTEGRPTGERRALKPGVLSGTIYRTPEVTKP